MARSSATKQVPRWLGFRSRRIDRIRTHDQQRHRSRCPDHDPAHYCEKRWALDSRAAIPRRAARPCCTSSQPGETTAAAYRCWCMGAVVSSIPPISSCRCRLRRRLVVPGCRCAATLTRSEMFDTQRSAYAAWAYALAAAICCLGRYGPAGAAA
jgi:hypothetical protein